MLFFTQSGEPNSSTRWKAEAKDETFVMRGFVIADRAFAFGILRAPSMGASFGIAPSGGLFGSLAGEAVCSGTVLVLVFRPAALAISAAIATLARTC